MARRQLLLELTISRTVLPSATLEREGVVYICDKASVKDSDSGLGKPDWAGPAPFLRGIVIVSEAMGLPFSRPEVRSFRTSPRASIRHRSRSSGGNLSKCPERMISAFPERSRRVRIGRSTCIFPSLRCVESKAWSSSTNAAYSPAPTAAKTSHRRVVNATLLGAAVVGSHGVVARGGGPLAALVGVRLARRRPARSSDCAAGHPCSHGPPSDKRGCTPSFAPRDFANCRWKPHSGNPAPCWCSWISPAVASKQLTQAMARSVASEPPSLVSTSAVDGGPPGRDQTWV
jgi:hypothetical protein